MWTAKELRNPKIILYSAYNKRNCINVYKKHFSFEWTIRKEWLKKKKIKGTKIPMLTLYCQISILKKIVWCGGRENLENLLESPFRRVEKFPNYTSMGIKYVLLFWQKSYIRKKRIWCPKKGGTPKLNK